LFAEALAEARRLDNRGIFPYLVGDAAVVAAEDGDLDRATRLFGAASAAFAAAGEVPDPDDAAEQDSLRASLTGRMGDEAFRAAFEEGTRLTIDEALGLSI